MWPFKKKGIVTNTNNNNVLINHVIEESKFNSILINGSKYTYVRKFAPHLTLRWSKREMLLDKIKTGG